MQREITITEIQLIPSKNSEVLSEGLLISLEVDSGEKTKKENYIHVGNNLKVKDMRVLNFYDEQRVVAKVYQGLQDQGLELLGEGYANLKGIKNSSTFECKINKESEHLATIYAKTFTRNLPPSPYIIFQNIKFQFDRNYSNIQNKDSSYRFRVENNDRVLQTTLNDHSKVIEWDENLYLKINDDNEFVFEIWDEKKNENVCVVSASIEEFKEVSGKKDFYVTNRQFQVFGVLSFDFQTHSLLTTKQIIKANEKEQNQMHSIWLSDVQGNIPDLNDQIISLRFKTENSYLNSTKIQMKNHSFAFNLNDSFYSSSQILIIQFAIALWKQNAQKIIGFGSGVFFPGNNKITVKNWERKPLGTMNIKMEKNKLLTHRCLTIKDLKLKIKSGNYIIGTSEPFIEGKVGKSIIRTETIEGQEMKFQRNMKFKFTDQKQFAISIWEEDLKSQDKLYEEIMNFENFKKNRGDIKFNFKKNLDGAEREAQLSFRYEYKVVKNLENEDNIERSLRNSMRKLQKFEKQEIVTQGNSSKRLKSNYESELTKSEILKLPPIQFGNRIYDNQSSGTLQTSIHSFSIPKSSRFQKSLHGYSSGEFNYNIERKFMLEKSKGASFGFGEKQTIPRWVLKNMKNPPPGAYDPEQRSDKNKKGPSFGISHKHYEKVGILKQTKSVKEIRYKNI